MVSIAGVLPPLCIGKGDMIVVMSIYDESHSLVAKLLGGKVERFNLGIS